MSGGGVSELKQLLGKKQLLCIGAGLALGILAQTAQEMNSSQDSLVRPDFGQEETRQALVEGLAESEEVLLDIPLSPRQYTGEEVLEVYAQILEELPGRILGENPSLTEVRTDLDLVREIPEYGVSLEWESERPESLDSYGNVQKEALGTEAEQVRLSVRMSDGGNPADYELLIRILPEEETPVEQLTAGFLKQLKKEDYDQRFSPVLKLPQEYQGRRLSYRKVQEPVFLPVAFLGLSAALLLVVKERSQKQQEQQQKKNQLLSDYPELLTRMIIFLGAGMTTRTAWEQIVGDYQRFRGLKKREKRWVYEEMEETCRQFKRGVPEGQAYMEFGKRCGLPCYTKLAGHLEQSRKNGTKNLRELLKLAMDEAFEQRKHQARRLGEEAGTKLLLPLFLMLGVVMVMVAVPAMMEFM